MFSFFSLLLYFFIFLCWAFRLVFSSFYYHSIRRVLTTFALFEVKKKNQYKLKCTKDGLETWKLQLKWKQKKLVEYEMAHLLTIHGIKRNKNTPFKLLSFMPSVILILSSWLLSDANIHFTISIIAPLNRILKRHILIFFLPLFPFFSSNTISSTSF